MAREHPQSRKAPGPTSGISSQKGEKLSFHSQARAVASWLAGSVWSCRRAHPHTRLVWYG
jgi:hypothetical protein